MNLAHQAKVLEVEQSFRQLLPSQIERDPLLAPISMESADEDCSLFRPLKHSGLFYPLLVSEVKPDRYLLIDGYRRLACLKALGIQTIPCIIAPRLSAESRKALRIKLHYEHQPQATE